MKMAREQEKAEGEKSGRKLKKSKAAGIVLSDEEQAQFETLRSLRMAIAKEERVPPYVAFSDKALTHMCRMQPMTKAEMLSVPGVGEFKFQKYGERFLKEIKKRLKTEDSE